MLDLYHNLPHLDLHGYDREYARIAINDFINDNYKMKNYKVIIVHGIGSGILKRTTQLTLKSNRYVEEYKIDNFNDGQTIIKIKKRLWHISLFVLL